MTDKKALIRAAIEALPGSYVPYSHFHVAAALLCADGSVYTGINIENASYTPTICAERSAFFRAVNEGRREFEAIVICGGKEGVITDYCAPCGVCRQVMREFCDPETFQIILAKSEEEYREFTLKELLPMGFGPENLM
ncbi:MAG: cytidine deaminase [Hungatella sp.]|nr:cytidine deaminase [Hungatella sp.]